MAAHVLRLAANDKHLTLTLRSEFRRALEKIGPSGGTTTRVRGKFSICDYLTVDPENVVEVQWWVRKDPGEFGRTFFLVQITPL